MRNQLDKLNFLHVFNDGFLVALGLLLPFIIKDLGIGLTEAGILGGIVNGMGVFLALPAGYLAARFGGMRLLIGAMGVYGVSYFIGAAATSFLGVLGGFFIAGLAFGVFHPIAFALVAKFAGREQRGRAMGNFTAIGDVGRILIAALVTFLAVEIGWRQTSLVYGSIAVVTFIVLFVLNLKSQRAAQIADTKAVKSESLPLKVSTLLRDPDFALTSLASTLDSFSSSALFIFLPFLLLAKGFDAAILGGLTGAFFVGNILGKLYLGRFVDRFGDKRVFITAEILMAVLILLLLSAQNLVLIIAVAIVLGILTKGTVPVAVTLVAGAVDKHNNYERAFSINSLFTNIGMTLSPIVLGFISDRAGIQAGFVVMALSAIAAAVPILFYHAD